VVFRQRSNISIVILVLGDEHCADFDPRIQVPFRYMRDYLVGSLKVIQACSCEVSSEWD